MNYPAFTDDSLTMIYEGVRGALAADDAMSTNFAIRPFESARRLTGGSTPQISTPKCL
jgi:hypothetical protein